MGVTANHLPQEQQNQSQDLGIEHNALDNRQSDPSTHQLPPSGQHQCRRTGKNGWNCQVMASPGNIYCDKHRLEQDMHNERRRNARQKKESPFLMDPVLPSGQRQCRRTEKGWRCSHLAPPTKIYCQKHELEQNTHSEKKEKRKRKDRGVIGCDEMKSSSGDCSTVSKRTREKDGVSIVHVRVESPKRESGKDVASKESLFPVNEGVVDEHADKNLSIAQIDSAQLLCPILEEHQDGSFVHEKANSSIMEDNDDNQLIPVYPITTRESTVEIIDPQCSNEVEDLLDFEFLDDEGVLPAVNMACSSPLQHEEASFLLESGSCNLPDERSKTAAKEFVGEKHQFDKIPMFEELESLKAIPQHSDFHSLEEENESKDEEKALPSADTTTKTSSSPIQQENGDLHVKDEYCSTIESSQMLEVIDFIDTSELISQDSNSCPLGDEVKEDCELTNLKVPKDVDARSQLEELLKLKDEYNLPDERSKTAAKEFVGEKHQFDTILARLNMRLETILAEVEMKGSKVVELQRVVDEIQENIRPT